MKPTVTSRPRPSPHSSRIGPFTHHQLARNLVAMVRSGNGALWGGSCPRPCARLVGWSCGPSTLPHPRSRSQTGRPEQMRRRKHGCLDIDVRRRTTLTAGDSPEEIPVATGTGRNPSTFPGMVISRLVLPAGQISIAWSLAGWPPIARPLRADVIRVLGVGDNRSVFPAPRPDPSIRGAYVEERTSSRGDPGVAEARKASSAAIVAVSLAIGPWAA